MIYPAIFILSFVYFYLGGRVADTRLRNSLCCLGVLALAVFSGLRASDVGIDVHTYVNPLYRICIKTDNISSLWELVAADLATKDLEAMFVLVSYLSVKLVPSLNFLLFVYAAIILFSVAISINLLLRLFIREHHELYFALSFLCYELLLYNMSLTMIRQSIACSIILLGTSLFLSGKCRAGLLTSAFAVTFHNTALFGLLFLPIIYLIKKNKKNFLILSLVFIFIVAVSARVLYFPIMNLLSAILPISSRYTAYEYMTFTLPDLNLAWTYLVSMLMIGCIDILRRKVSRNLASNFLIFTVMMTIALFPISVTLPDAGRVLYYLFYFAPVVISLVVHVRSVENLSSYSASGAVGQSQRLSKEKKLIANVAFAIMFAFIFWMGNVGLNDYSGTVDYRVGITWQ